MAIHAQVRKLTTSSMAIKNNLAYVDTGAFIAFLDDSDTYYSLFRQLFADPPPLITTPLVIAEGHAWFLKRYDMNRALQFMGFVEDLKILEILDIGESVLQESNKYLKKFSDQDLTLADASGLYVMQKHKIKHCWSTDYHLGLTKVPLVIYE